jgi:hypothetical protein
VKGGADLHQGQHFKQDTANQRLEPEAVAERSGWRIVKV